MKFLSGLFSRKTPDEKAMGLLSSVGANGDPNLAKRGERWWKIRAETYELISHVVNDGARRYLVDVASKLDTQYGTSTNQGRIA